MASLIPELFERQEGRSGALGKIARQDFFLRQQNPAPVEMSFATEADAPAGDELQWGWVLAADLPDEASAFGDSLDALPPEHIADLIAAAAEQETLQFRRELLAALRAGDLDGALERVQTVLDLHAPRLAEALGEAKLMAALAGMVNVANAPHGELRPSVESEPVAPETVSPLPATPFSPLIAAAVADLESRGLMTRLRFDAASAAARHEAFTVAGLATAQAIGVVRDALADAVAKGTSHEEFDRTVEAELGKNAFLSPAHAETVWRGGVMEAYSRGQEQLLADPLVGALYPYAAIDETHDDRVRPWHLALERHGIDGTNIYRRDDPIWPIIRPPSDFGCRGVWRPVSVREAARKGVREAQEWLRTGKPPETPTYCTLPKDWKTGFTQRDEVAMATGLELSDGPHKYGSTQFNIADVADAGDTLAALKALADAIPDADLAADGREEEAHITILYGIHGDDAEAVRQAIEGFGPVTLTLGKTSLFPAKEPTVQRGGDSYDVVKVDVEGDDIRRLHDQLAEALEHTDTHPTYRPHLTIAYVKPGRGEKYADNDAVAGKKLVCTQLVFSSAEGERTTIALADSDDSADAKHLANLYADILNALADAGQDVEEDVASANEELEDTGWCVEKKGGRWQACERGVEMAAAHAPAGGIEISGKSYRGGQFIPGSEVAKATPEQKERLEAGPRARQERLKGRGVTSEGLAAKLAPHTGTLSAAERRAAAASFRALQSHHGDLTLARIDELAERLQAAHAGVGDDHPAAEGLRAQFASRLAQLHHMLSLHGEREAKRPPWEAKTGTVDKSKVYQAPVAALHVDPARFQFKLNVDRSGVTEELKGVKTFNPEFAGVVSVWKDPADGKTYIINGHHRYELAHRTGHPDLAVRYIAAKDAVEARGVGAMINIAEGRGTAVDAAKFMRDCKLTPEEAEAKGISMKGKLAADAISLTKLNDRLFDRVARGTFDQTKALAIAKHLDDHDLQDKLFGLLDKREEAGKDISPKVIEEMAREMAETPKATKTEHSLFGDIESEESLFVERNELKTHVRGELGREVNDFLAVSNKRRAEKVGKAGNVLDVAENKRIAEEAERVKNVYETLVNRKGPVSDAVNAAAAEYAGAKTRSQRDAVKRKAVESIRDAVFHEAGVGQSGTEGGAVGGGGAAAGAEPGAAATASTNAGRGDSEPVSVGQKVAVPASHTAGAFDGEIVDAGKGRIGLQQAGSTHGPAVVFKDGEQARRFLNDLSGKVVGKADAPDESINRVLSQDAKFLGRGNDGLAFDTGDGNVVKASSEVPYHWNNGLRSAEEGADRLRNQVKANDALLAAKVPGILPQKLIEHGGRAFVVMPKLNLEDPLTAEHLQQVKESVKAAHEAGYTFGDDIQAGIGKDGRAYVFDTGAARKLGDGRNRQADIQDDESRLGHLFEKAGVPFKGINPSLDYDAALQSVQKHVDSGKPMSPALAELRRKKLERLYGNLDPDEQELLSDNHKELLSKVGADSGGGGDQPGGLKEEAPPELKDAPSDAAGHKVAKDGTVWAKAPAGGMVSQVNGQHYKGGQWMPIHGLSVGQDRQPAGEPQGGGMPLVNPDGEPGGPRRKPEEKKPRRPESVRDRMGDLVEVPEGNVAIEKVVAGSPSKRLSDDALAYLGLTRKQADDLKEIYEANDGAPYLPREIIPGWNAGNQKEIDPSWDVAAKWKAYKKARGEDARRKDAERTNQIVAEEKASANAVEKPAKQRDYSDQEKSHREQQRVYGEVIGDPTKASAKDLVVARGHLETLLYHEKKRHERGDTSDEQYAGLVDSLRRDADYIDQIYKDRINGRAPGPEDQSRAEKIAEKSAIENRPVMTIAKEMGLTLDEFRDIRADVEKHLDEFRSIGKEPSAGRKKAMERHKELQAKEAEAEAAPVAEKPKAATKPVFSVGDHLQYTGRGADPDETTEFRGFHTDPSTGEKMARVIFRPRSGPPFETSVRPEDLKAVAPVEKPTASETESHTPLTDAELFKGRDQEAFRKLQTSLGVKKPEVGEKGANKFRQALKDHPAGAVIGALLRVDGSETGYDQNGFALRGNDAYRTAVDGQFTRKELDAAAEWLQSKFSAGESRNVNQYRWIRGAVQTARPKEEESTANPDTLTAIPPGGEGFVDGHRVHRLGPTAYRVETDRGFVHGTAAQVREHIERQLKDQKPDQKRIDAALQRHADKPPAQLMTEGFGREQEAFAALPAGTRVVIAGGNYRGRIGEVEQTESGPRVKLDGSPERIPVQAADVEPLDAKQSWRIEQAPPPPKAKQGGLFEAAAPAKPRSKASLVGQGYMGGTVDVPITPERKTLIERVAAVKYGPDRRDQIVQLIGEANTKKFFDLKIGGVDTVSAVIKAMGWDREAEAT